MAAVVIPVLLSFLLGPGTGQLYNREYKKGFLLIAVSFIVLTVGGVWYYKNLQPYLPKDLTSIDPQAMQQLMMNAASQLSSAKGFVLAVFEALLTVLWIYGVVDSYFGAQRKRRA